MVKFINEGSDLVEVSIFVRGLCELSNSMKYVIIFIIPCAFITGFADMLILGALVIDSDVAIGR
ncbi:hypothetical protein GCM10008934_07430 [Virgibacillus salarius]